MGDSTGEARALQDSQIAEAAFLRVKAEMDALDATNLAAMNVDVVAGTSIVLGVASRVLAFRDRMKMLPEFDLKNVDNLLDYAHAAWFAYVTNLPVPEPNDAEALMREVAELRKKLLRWAEPLAEEGVFDTAAVRRIKEGSGNKDTPSDVVALVALFRAHWDQIKDWCKVTEADLQRGGEIGPQVFAIVSRRENPEFAKVAEGSLRVRRAWTLLDRAYDQCRRAIQYLRYDEGDADDIAPSLRRNSGRRETSNTTPVTASPVSPAASPASPAPSPAGAATPAPATAPAAATDPVPLPTGGPLPGSVAVGSSIGNGGSPFTS